MAEWLREVSVGAWYEADGQSFEIVGIDAQAGVVLVQHFDGALEEFDFDSWLDLNARPCAPPEDVSGAFDMDREDDEPRPWPGLHGNPLDALERGLYDD